MSHPRIVTREEWVAARKELLAKEKELTRQCDALNTERRNLPMVEVTKDYVFDGPNGQVRLVDLFQGRSQRMIYHFMFDPAWEDGCSSCTGGTDELSPGFFDHLHSRDTPSAAGDGYGRGVWRGPAPGRLAARGSRRPWERPLGTTVPAARSRQVFSKP